MIMPLSLTLLSAAVKPERRNAALGIWGAIGGAAIALGPLVGGAVTTGWSWHYIFWLNVPIGIILVPLAWWKLAESRGDPESPGLSRGPARQWRPARRRPRPRSRQRQRLDQFERARLLRASAPCCSRPSSDGNCAPRAPMLNLRMFRNRGFAAINVTALLFSFGMFGTVFFLSQFLQTVQGYSPLGAGLRVLPWTGMPMLLAPVGRTARAAHRRQAARRHRPHPAGDQPDVVGAALDRRRRRTRDMVPAFIVAGVGMTLFFVPVASLVLGSVPKEHEGRRLGHQRRVP